MIYANLDKFYKINLFKIILDFFLNLWYNKIFRLLASNEWYQGSNFSKKVLDMRFKFEYNEHIKNEEWFLVLSLKGG